MKDIQIKEEDYKKIKQAITDNFGYSIKLDENVISNIAMRIIATKKEEDTII